MVQYTLVLVSSYAASSTGTRKTTVQTSFFPVFPAKVLLKAQTDAPRASGFYSSFAYLCSQVSSSELPFYYLMMVVILHFFELLLVMFEFADEL